MVVVAQYCIDYKMDLIASIIREGGVIHKNFVIGRCT